MKPILLKSRRVGFSAVVGMILAACSSDTSHDESSTNEWTVVRDTVGDTVVVRTVSGSVGAPLHRLELELSIGLEDGADEYLLGNIRAMAVGAAGDIFAYDSDVPIIRQYDLDGLHVRNLGRGGEGPGEYRQVASMGILPDDRLVIGDARLGRVSVYSSDGTFATSWRDIGGQGSSQFITTSAAGAVYVFTGDMEVPPDERIPYFVEYGLDGEPRDTFASPEAGFEPISLSVSGPTEGGRVSIGTYLPFSPMHWQAMSPGGYVVWGTSDRYAITLGRDEPFRIERDAEPVAVLTAEAQDKREMVNGLMHRVDKDWRWTGPSIPDVKPFFRQIVVASDERVWLLLSTRGEQIDNDDGSIGWREPTRYDVWEPDGRYLGEVAVPDRTWVMVMRGDQVWGVARDVLDIPKIVRFRIVPGLGETAP